MIPCSYCWGGAKKVVGPAIGHDPPYTRKHPCPVCNDTFVEPQELMTVTLPFAPNEDPQITCLYCRKQTLCEYVLTVLRPGEVSWVGCHAACLEPLQVRNPYFRRQTNNSLEMTDYAANEEAITFARDVLGIDLTPNQRQILAAKGVTALKEMLMGINEEFHSAVLEEANDLSQMLNIDSGRNYHGAGKRSPDWHDGWEACAKPVESSLRQILAKYEPSECTKTSLAIETANNAGFRSALHEVNNQLLFLNRADEDDNSRAWNAALSAVAMFVDKQLKLSDKS